MQVPLIAETQGLPRGFELAEQAAHLAGVLEEEFDRFLWVLGLFLLEKLKHALEHGQIRAAGERVLAGGDHRALDRLVLGNAIDDRVEFLHHLFGEDIHGFIGHIPGHECNAVRVDVEFEVRIAHLLSPQTRSMMVAVPMPAPMHSVTSAN